MRNAAIWRSRPVFVTSTFLDMDHERDYLRHHVFPALDERLRARRSYLEPIDLRWGVETVTTAEEHTRELQILKVCLGEVERSRPFLIALLGDRYGRVLPADRVAAAAQEVGFERAAGGCSLTELEIDFGVLASPAQRHRCFFYFRDPLPYDQMEAATAAQYSDGHAPSADPAAAGRLAALKRRIETALPERVRHYTARWENGSVTGLEAWGQMVLEDLWREFDAKTADQIAQSEPTWQEAERWALEQFVEDRTRSFIGRDAILAELLALATSPPKDGSWGVCVTGPAGAGKSAVFAELVRRLQREDVLVLAHAAGISPRSPSVDAMLRRWIEELASLLGEPTGLADTATADQVNEAFHRLLGRASARRRVVVLVDALNQFEPTPRGRHVTWLPALWPPEARLIVTAIPGPGSEALARRAGVRSITLPPLGATEAGAIAQAVCERYHRTMNAAALMTLLAKPGPGGQPAAGNALWTSLAVEELNLLDADDLARAEREFMGGPEARLEQLLVSVAGAMPGDVEGLYGWLLDRAEALHGSAWARALVNAIAVSRGGWREADLEAVIPALAGEPWDALRFAALRRTLRAHLVQRGAQAQWDFAHVQMRAAVRRQNLGDEEALRAVHRILASHLAALPREDALHETELMVHLMGSDDAGAAARYYAGSLTDGEAAGATQALAAQIVAGEDTRSRGHSRVTALLAQPMDDHARYSLCDRFVFNLADALEGEGPLDLRLEVLIGTRGQLERLTAQDPGNAAWQRNLSVSQARIGDVLVAQGDGAGALAAYRASLGIRERLAAQDPGNAAWQRNLSVSRNKVGDVLVAHGDGAGALAAYRASHAIFERLAAQDPGNAEWQRDLSVSHNNVGNMLVAHGDGAGALAAYRAGHAIAERMAAQDPGNAAWQRNLSVSQDRIGNVLVAQGDGAGALAAYRASHAIFERLVAQDPGNAAWQRDLSVSHNKVGDVLVAQGDGAGALAAYRAGLAIAERLAAQDPGNATWQRDLSVSHIMVGDVLMDQGDGAGALAAYRAALAIAERLAAQDPGNAACQQDLSASQERIGNVLVAHGDGAGALAAYRAGHAICERLAAQDPGNAAWQRNLSVSHIKVGNVLVAHGDGAGALAAYRAGHAICERLAAQDPGNAAWQRNLSVSHIKVGDVLVAHRDGAGALAAYRAGHAICERLAAQDPGNATWQRDLSVSHNKVGDVLVAQGDGAGALAAYRVSHAIFERLAAQDPGNAEWQRDLSVSHNKVGDVLGAQGDGAGALAAYRASLGIRERLAAQDPGNAAWQRNLSVSRNKVGDVLVAQGDGAGALAAYRAGLAIAERLAAQDPGNAEWQRDLSVSYEKIGDIIRAQGDLLGALGAYQARHAIAEQLASQDRANALWQRDLVESFHRLGIVADLRDSASAARYWKACHQTLLSMKQNGMDLDSEMMALLRDLDTRFRSDETL